MPDDVPSVPEPLAQALRTFANHKQILIALDFDGTLAPFVIDPADARPVPAASTALDALARQPGVQVALVSGRPVQVLHRLASPPPGSWLVGSHGAEWAEVDSRGEVTFVPFDLTPDQASALARVRNAVDEISRAHPGSRVEYKPAAVGLHTRSLPEQEAERALAEALVGPGSAPDVWAIQGKQVTEIAVVHASKGTAVATLRERLGAKVLFAGDDVTDETALAVLGTGDVGIKVGDTETVAAFRVTGEVALGEALGYLRMCRASLFHP